MSGNKVARFDPKTQLFREWDLPPGHRPHGLLVDRGGMSGMRAFLGRLGQGESLPQALKDGIGVSVEDVEARLLAAGGRS